MRTSGKKVYEVQMRLGEGTFSDRETLLLLASCPGVASRKAWRLTQRRKRQEGIQRASEVERVELVGTLDG